MINEFILGNGTVFIGSLFNKETNQFGILIRETGEKREINTFDPRFKEGEAFIAEENDTIIWFNNIEGARVLQDRVNIACLQLQNYKVIDLLEVKE